MLFIYSKNKKKIVKINYKYSYKYIKCPYLKNKKEQLLHPNVFLKFNKKNITICPYCNTIYKLY